MVAMFSTPSPIVVAQQGPEMLGTIVMIELRDEIWIPEDLLAQLWRDVGLPAQECPGARNPTDAFRFALPKPKQSDETVFHRYEGRAMPKQLQLAAILTHRNAAKTRFSLTHRNRGYVGLTHGREIEIGLAKDGTHKEQLQFEQVKRRYEKARAQVDGSLIRGAFGRLLYNASAVPVRDGVKVVPAGHDELVRQMVELTRELDAYAPTPNIAFSAVYANVGDQADQLAVFVEQHVRKEIERRLREVKDGNLGARRSRSLLSELNDLGQMVERYREVLGEGMRDLARYTDMQRALIERELTF